MQGVERLPSASRLEGKGLPFVLGCRLISFICMSCRTCLLLLFRVGENTRCLLNAGLQNSLEVLEFVRGSQADELIATRGNRTALILRSSALSTPADFCTPLGCIPVRMRRPAVTGNALSRSPSVETSGAHSSGLKRVPQMSAIARPKVFFARRPTAARTSDARSGRLTLSLNVVVWGDGRCVGFHSSCQFARCCAAFSLRAIAATILHVPYRRV